MTMHPRTDWPGDTMDAFVSIKGQDAMARLMGLVPGKPTGKVKFPNINQGGVKSRSKRNESADRKRKKVIDALRKFGPMNHGEIVKASGVSSDAVGYCLSVLRQRGMIEQTDPRNKSFNKWKLVE